MPGRRKQISRAISRPHHAPSNSGITQIGVKRAGQPASGVSIEEIARLARHASTRTTEVVYRRELRPVITTGAGIMDDVFGEASRS